MPIFVPAMVLFNIVLLVAPFTLISAGLHRRRLLALVDEGKDWEGSAPFEAVSIGGVALTSLPFMVAHALSAAATFTIWGAMASRVNPSVWVAGYTEMIVIPVFPIAVSWCSRFASSYLYSIRRGRWVNR